MSRGYQRYEWSYNNTQSGKHKTRAWKKKKKTISIEKTISRESLNTLQLKCHPRLPRNYTSINHHLSSISLLLLLLHHQSEETNNLDQQPP